MHQKEWWRAMIAEYSTNYHNAQTLGIDIKWGLCDMVESYEQIIVFKRRY